MTLQRYRAALLVSALLLATTLAGCQAFAWILVKTIGPWMPEETAQAEYDLKNKSLLVLVDAKDPSLLSEFPRLESAIGTSIIKQLGDNKACGPIVPVHSLDNARRAEPKFNEWSVAQVGKYFNVDLVMHVEILEFRLRDTPGSTAFHGYTEAAVRLVSPQTGDQVWPVLATARLISAEAQPDMTSEERGEQETALVDGFSDKVARVFYTYKIEDLPKRPKVK